MTDRITTEEAERIAGDLAAVLRTETSSTGTLPSGRPAISFTCVKTEWLAEAAAALRALAAERDELRTMCKWTGEWLTSSEGSVITHADLVTLLPLLERAELGEEGP